VADSLIEDEREIVAAGPKYARSLANLAIILQLPNSSEFGELFSR
jgi:hypothetical protein